jgi:2-keto-3-deoxy-6-phosphogluconate aldolase
MARQLLIGNNVAMAYTGGVLANGAISVQKLTPAGPTEMVAADTIATSAQFRIVQGTGSKNIVSPWIYGKDVIDYSGKSFVAPTAQVLTATFAINATAAGNHTFKVINKANGAEPFEMKSYTFSVAAGATPTTQATAIAAAMVADMPHWVSTATSAGAVVTITGFMKGAVLADGSIQEHAVTMDAAWDGASNGTTMADVYTGGLRGYGGFSYVKEMEENLRGANYGYYNRIAQPITPAQTAVNIALGGYDMYSIVATKDGSSASQINGVDNLIEITIAFDNGNAAPSALTTVLEGKLNPYLISAGFAAVTL